MSSSKLSSCLFALSLIFAAFWCESFGQDSKTDEQAETARPPLNDDRIAELTEQILAKPFEQRNYRLRALEFAKGEAWDEAAADYRKIVEVNPAKSQLWQQAATLTALSEDVEHYKAFCDKMLGRFGATEHLGTMERLPKVCCLSPRPVGDLGKHKAMAEASVEASADSYWSCYHPRTLALVHYRLKEYARAQEAIAKSDRLNVDIDERRFGDIDVSNRAIEAMCLIRRGNLEEGKTLLAKATPTLKAKMADLDEFYADEFWHDWLIAKILHDEAQQLIEAGGMGDVKWGKGKLVSDD